MSDLGVGYVGTLSKLSGPRAAGHFQAAENGGVGLDPMDCPQRNLRHYAVRG